MRKSGPADTSHIPRDDSSAHFIELGHGFLKVVEHERVVADLPQLHDGVHENTSSALALQQEKSG